MRKIDYIKEMINLYEAKRHQDRLEDRLKQANNETGRYICQDAL